MNHISPLATKRVQQRSGHGPLSQRPGIVVPPPIDASGRRLPPIRLPPLTQTPEIGSHHAFAPVASPTCASILPPLSSQKQYPKTPTFQMPEPVSVIVARCLRHPTFRVVEQKENDIFHFKKENPHAALANDLNTILRVVRSKGLRMTLTNGDYNQLIRMICRYIFNQKQRLPIRNPFGENIPAYTITNYNLLETVHAILQALIVDPILVAPFIDRNFVAFLIDELDTPVIALQQQVESELSQIVDSFQDLGSFCTRSLLARIVEYNDGHRSPYCVAPILRILQAYFEKNASPKADSIYRDCIVPLYYTDFLSDFEKPIRAMTSYFCKKDGRNAEFCLNGLLNHWPITNPRKEVSFIQQFTMLLQNVPEKALPKVCIKVLRVMAKCIQSQHSGISLSACFLLMDSQFLCSFASVKDQFATIIVPGLRRAKNHWKADQKSMAEQLLNTLGDEDSLKGDDELVKREAEVKSMWDQLSNQTALPLSSL